MPDRALPARIDLGAIACEPGFFLPRDAAQAPFQEPSSSDPWQFCSTFRGSPTTLRDCVLELVRAARHKIFVTSFILGDQALAAELTSAADRLTGGVYVISELSENSLRRGLARLEEINERGEEISAKVEVEKKRFMSLTRNGVAVRGHENCHAKFMVVDDVIAWVGSANLETRAFTEVGEVGVVISDPVEVDRLARLFARMWLAGSRYHLPAADDYSVQNREGTCTVTVPRPPGRPPSLIWTDEDDNSLLTAVHEVIGAARHELLLASYSLDGMTGRPDLLLDPVAKAMARGVEVTMLVRALNHRDRHRRDAAELHDLGVRLVADRYNHAKAVVADNGAMGALFSANFDAFHGLDPGSGLEIGARLDGTPALSALTRYLRHTLTNADHEFVRRPLQRQVNEAKIFGASRAWPLPAELRVRAAPEDWCALAHAATQGPAFWARQNNTIELIAGQQAWPLHQTHNGQSRLGPHHPKQPSSVNRYPSHCPAVLIYDGP
ncbi:phospholipase D-like domain-containing protein [Actinomadura coerulea]|uniref:phospholipase D-like domain-containing protein n=1 Tax=Actinomadura coerulea TaxID=46159 RepID=UPI003416D760